MTDAFAQLEILPNGPFAGAYVPLEHYGTDARVQSVMLEIRRDVYLHDSLELKSEAFHGLQASLQRLVNSVVGES